MSQFVSQEWLMEHLKDSNLRIVDCRFDLQHPSWGREAFREAHLPEAVYLDLERDLSAPSGKHGGRHPLPDVKNLAFKLGGMGINHRTHVVIYDNQDGAMAARLWWLLKYMGHQKVSVLNVGFDEWKKKNGPVTEEIFQPRQTQFVPFINEKMAVDANYVLSIVKDENKEKALIDSRESMRYKGKEEPIDKKAGHIPGAQNWFWKDNLKNSKWLDNNELKNRFEPLFEKSELTVYCGSGVTACANILALTEAGHPNIRLYPGSWSDWISYHDFPIEKE